MIYLSAVFVEDPTAGAKVGDSEELQGWKIGEQLSNNAHCLSLNNWRYENNQLLVFNACQFLLSHETSSLADTKKNPDGDKFKKIQFFWRGKPSKMLIIECKVYYIHFWELDFLSQF